MLYSFTTSSAELSNQNMPPVSGTIELSQAAFDQLHQSYLDCNWSHASYNDEFGHSHSYFRFHDNRITRTTYTHIIPA